MHWPCIFDFSVFPWLQKFQFYVNFNNFCTINIDFFLEILCSMRLWVRTTVLKLCVRVCECMCSDGRCCHCVCSDGRGGVNVAALTSSLYEAQLDNLLTSAKLLDTANVPDCLTGTGLGFYIPDVSGSVTSADLSLSRWVCLSHTHTAVRRLLQLCLNGRKSCHHQPIPLPKREVWNGHTQLPVTLYKRGDMYYKARIIKLKINKKFNTYTLDYKCYYNNTVCPGTS